MADQKIGQLLDTLGVTADLTDGDMVTDAVVILKLVKGDGSVSLYKARSEAVDWITALGLITAAHGIENSGYQYADSDED